MAHSGTDSAPTMEWRVAGSAAQGSVSGRWRREGGRHGRSGRHRRQHQGGHRGAQRRVRRQHAEVAMAMDPRRRDEGGEAVDQLQRGKELWAAAARAGFAGVVKQAFGIECAEPVQGEWWAGAVTQQSLPPQPIRGLDAHRGARSSAGAPPKQHRGQDSVRHRR